MGSGAGVALGVGDGTGVGCGAGCRVGRGVGRGVGVDVGRGVGCGVAVDRGVGDGVGVAPGDATLPGASDANTRFKQIVRTTPCWLRHSVVCSRNPGRPAKPRFARHSAALGTAGVAAGATAPGGCGCAPVFAVPALRAAATFMHCSKRVVNALGVTLRSRPGTETGAAPDGTSSAATMNGKQEAIRRNLAEPAPIVGTPAGTASGRVAYVNRRSGMTRPLRRRQGGSAERLFEVY